MIYIKQVFYNAIFHHRGHTRYINDLKNYFINVYYFLLKFFIDNLYNYADDDY